MENPGFDSKEEKNSTGSTESSEISTITTISSSNSDNDDSTNSNAISDKKSKDNNTGLYYSINDEPPWYLTLFLGFQHYLTMAGSTVSVPVIITPLLCMSEDDPNKATIISTIMFVSGIVTLLQSTFGTRLPIIQGGSFSFVVPTLAILGLEQWKCPSLESIEHLTEDERLELWQVRIREIQGAIIIASLFEVALGFFGIVGIILKFITPLTVAPAIAMIGISLFKVSATHAASNWWISGATIVLIIIFSQYMKNYKVPIPFTKSGKRKGTLTYPLFQVFPVLLTIGSVWLLCYIFTATDVFPVGNPGRTDIKSNIITNTPWFRVPYPFQWGWPTISTGAVLGMLSGVIAGMVESIGDYYACARISGAKSPPEHAISRGIFIEGIGCVLAGIWGTGNGTTSYSENIGAISVTKVGSRRVIQAAGGLMIICALIGKIGAVFISIPEPIIGGIFCIVFATVTAVGLSNLQGVDLNSGRNIFVIGFSLFFGLTISQWIESNPNIISTGSTSLDQILTILLRTGMFVSGVLGFFLDNTIPGSAEERGLITWASHIHTEDNELENTNTSKHLDGYDLPVGMNLINRLKFCKRIPISPTYEKSIFSKLKLPVSNKERNS